MGAVRSVQISPQKLHIFHTIEEGTVQCIVTLATLEAPVTP